MEKDSLYSLAVIEKELNNHGEALIKIQEALTKLALRQEQITVIQNQVADLLEKYSLLANPDGGMLVEIKRFQASCPRESITTNIKWLWTIVIPISLTQLALSIRLLK